MSGAERVPVLLVEYSARLRSAYAEHLTAQGFDVTSLADAALALDHLRRHGAWVMVLNIGLPGMSGGDAIEQAVEIDPDLAVIALSVVNDAAIAAHCMRRGATDFLIKPVEPTDLQSAVSRAVKRRQASQIERGEVTQVRQDYERRLALLSLEIERRERMAVEALEALVRALENKNPYFGGHSWRVAETAAAVAERLGMSDEDVRHLRLAGKLHDVGMIGVKEEVTNKDGPLSQEELDHVRRHVTVGAQILSPLAHLAPVIESVRSHHERWDGSGYPEGAVGQEIPFGGRILAAAEVYDALRSERPYRRPFSRDDAVGHVRSLGGVVLDPEVSGALASLMHDGQTAESASRDGTRELGAG